MENTKKKKNDTIENLPFWKKHYPLIFSILTLITLFLFFQIMFALSKIEFSTVLYPYLGAGIFINYAVLYFVFPSVLLVICVIIFKRNTSKNRVTGTMLSDIFAFALICFTGFMMFFVFFILIITSDSYSHKDTLEVNNQTYTLSGQNSYDDLGYGKFALYHCDNFALFCSKIYETSWGYYTSHPAELAYDAETQELLIIVNGEVVEAYQLE